MRPRRATARTTGVGRTESARASPSRPDAGAHPRRDAGLGERRSRAELRPAATTRLPPLRDRSRSSLPVGSLLADLERAEQAALAPADEGVHLRQAPAQSRVRGDPRRAPARPRRRSRDRPQGGGGRSLTGHVGPRHVRGRREVRRLRASPVSLDPGRDAIERRLQELSVDHDGDDPEAPDPREALLRVEAGLADGVRLSDEPAGHVPRSPSSGRRRTSASPRCGRGGSHG